MQKFRWILLLITILVALTVVLQNNETVPVELLWIQRRMPLSILLACTTAIGFLAGALMTASMLRKRGKSKSKSKAKSKPSESSRSAAASQDTPLK